VSAGPPPVVWRDPSNDPELERRIRQFALPAALLLAFFVSHSGLRGLARTFLSMWVHELGHAVSAWFCGFGAFPGPWRTPISEARMPIVTLLLLAGLGYAAYRAWVTGKQGLCAVFGVLLVMQVWLTFGLRPHAARAVILFMGDGGCFVLGTALMATLYVAPESPLCRGGLRWGFVVIGAFAFMDAFTTWWDAKHSREGVIFGAIEGVGDSDPTRLVFEYGWTEARLVARYLALAWACLFFLLGRYLLGLRRRE
jgi:hypothetical protein